MGQTDKPLLIIFYRNPIAGKVKTRLAAGIGDEKALHVFRRLALHTREITQSIEADKVVSYSDAIDDEDLWSHQIYLKNVQHGDDLGERMQKAFDEAFATGYTSVVIIGTDCYELTRDVIEDAFRALRHGEAVIGPAQDGGYYLLGMNEPHLELFQNKAWSTNTVLRDTIDDFRKLRLKYATLPTLRDVDREEDLPDELLG